MLRIVLMFGALIGSLLAGDVTDSVKLDSNCDQGKLLNMQITDCDAFPCVVKRGKNYTINANFMLDKDVVNPVAKCGTIYLGRQYTLAGYGGCQTITNGTCPLTGGVVYNSITTFNIPYYVPGIHYTLSCRFEDTDAKGLVCGSGSGRVV